MQEEEAAPQAPPKGPMQATGRITRNVILGTGKLGEHGTWADMVKCVCGVGER